MLEQLRDAASEKLAASQEAQKDKPIYLQNLNALSMLVAKNAQHSTYNAYRERLSAYLNTAVDSTSPYFSAMLVISGFESDPQVAFSIEERIPNPSLESPKQSDLVLRLKTSTETDRVEVVAGSNRFPLSMLPDLAPDVKVHRNEVITEAALHPHELGEVSLNFLNSFSQRALDAVRAHLLSQGTQEESPTPTADRVKIPVIADLPDNTTDPEIIRRQLEKMRTFDELGLFKDSRGGDEYIRELYGLEAFFSYVKYIGAKQVVDVGAGFGFGVADLRDQYKYADGLNFYATNLSDNEGLARNIPEEHVYLTSAEEMEGLEPETVGGIIALNSIAYSVSPETVTKRFDEILVPGGIIKASFRHRLDDQYKEYGFQTADEFIEFWSQLDYDLAVYKGLVVVAIKPGGNYGATAYDIAALDAKSHIVDARTSSWRTTTRSGERTYHEIKKAGWF
ncbi:MAG TPA: hypothetical protein VG965_06665 [Patescibacteria group bacterium]|nr:hypothetical protein [Patescibacteria group bacterium]